jgi:RNA polymerase sigma factor (sigma-70 family)
MSRIIPMTSDRQRLDDARLVRACRRGDERAWEELVRRFRRLIYSIPVTGYRICESDAEEIFQSVVVKLFENIARLRKTASLSTWIVTVTRNECRRFLRTSGRFSPGEIDDAILPPEEPPDVVRALDAIDREHRLALAFRKLDASSRELLHAMYVESPTPSYAELSERTGRPIGSLGPTRARALEKLRRLYVGLGGSDASAHPSTALRVEALLIRAS